MTSKIKVNNIEDASGNAMVSKCGTTVTLGKTGDTIQLATGASQSGFGRTGTVDWDTTAKTASFTAVSGNGYFINTTSGAITVTLPASPSAGNIVAIADYAGTAATNNITIARNSSKIESGTENALINSNRESKTFVYVDATQGWVIVNSNDESAIPSAFIQATGGTITCCGDYKIHTFTSPGSFTVQEIAATCGPTRNAVSYLVVGGGAGGGGGGCGGDGGGGGGAGGFREFRAPLSGCYSVSPLNGAPSISVTQTTFPITVGAGGTGGTGPGNGTSGSNSIFSTVTSAGGGFGKGNTGAPHPAGPGGSGGGGSGGGGIPAVGGDGNTPPVSPSQGKSGGAGGSPAGPNPQSPDNGSGGGGGATAVGGNAGGGPAGAGGAGATTSISASPTAYAGGGGGSGFPGGAGGTGGGGAGTNLPSSGTGTAGTANLGGGGGGGRNGGAGGSGVVIIRYKFQ